MNKTVHFSLALIFTVSFNAWAAPGTQFGATSDYKNPKDDKGLCTKNNENEFYYKFGLCESLAQFIKKDCTQQLLKQMRDNMEKPDKDGNYFSIGGNISCQSKEQGSQSVNLKNPVVFDNFITQFIAATVIQESNWDTLNGLRNTAGANHDGVTGGLLPLKNRKIYDDPQNACGCETINSQSKGSNNYTNDKTSGDKDGFQNLNCATYVALKKAFEDHTLFGGQKKAGASTNPTPTPTPANASSTDPDRPLGAATFFQSLRDAPLPPNPPADMLSGNPTLNNLEQKLQNFCQNSLKPDGSWIPGATDPCDICKPTGAAR